MASTSASADELAFQARIHQQFIPTENAEQDLIYTDVPVIELPDPEEERLRLEAEAKAKAEAEAKKKAESAAAAGPAAPAGPARYTGGGAPAEWMAAAGIPESDWGFVDYIANKESTWNPNATNASSGACGLIQAYPCSKVPGNGYDPVDNLRWASGYAADRYGGWAGAYDFWIANNWW
nr:transglycosylase SLT domain-containing protein [Leucobacter exalbidus]